MSRRIRRPKPGGVTQLGPLLAAAMVLGLLAALLLAVVEPSGVGLWTTP